MDTNTNTRRIVTAERGRLAPLVERVNGREMRDSFWGGFESAASRFALGRMDATEFRAVARELGRDAAGTASQQDRDADTVDGPETGGRAPWATMPTDGSGRATRAEKIVSALVGVSSALVLAWLVTLVALLTGGSPDAPASPSPGQITTDADMITRGGYWSWAVADGCGRGPAECSRVMRDVNGEAARFGLVVMEDGSIAPAGRY